jgi:beta-phosphoglucomutase family hydrolase
MKKLEVDPRAKGLIFDLDGTLVNSMPLHYLAWKEVCASGGVDFSEELFYELAGVPSNRIFEIINEKYGSSFDPEVMSLVKEDTYMKMLDRIKPVDAVLDVVKRYHGKLPMAIGTGSPREHSWKTVKAVGYDKYFDILISRDDITNCKPDPETFLKCAEAMGVNPEDCQVFEDGDPGLEAARKAGMIATDIRPWL